MLMPLAKPDEIKDLYQWNGGQPWWGLTDGTRSMSARLDSFRSQAARQAVYAVPMRIRYDFFTEGGYQRLAKEYRDAFLRSNPEMEKLAERVQKRPAVASLKDGVYVYLWGNSPAEDLSLVREMKASGVARGIAVFYGRHEVDRRCSTASRNSAGWRGCTGCRRATCSRSRGGGAGPRTCSWERLRPNDSWQAAISRAGTASVRNTFCLNGPRKPRG